LRNNDPIIAPSIIHSIPFFAVLIAKNVREHSFPKATINNPIVIIGRSNDSAKNDADRTIISEARAKTTKQKTTFITLFKDLTKLFCIGCSSSQTLVNLSFLEKSQKI
jgi:hypothetical protein